ncbi:MAG TPA: B-box zinc finger protein [Archangium sp.]|uniref:B-box zinc finger protein n=1 Tax=Archangium sp. TaxID=1872627 RepID=UPI002E30F54D|nr:B-box zinc finger protein [Archangium sp.]HEX5751472.1 B-box zinc finger protein [Archangium sp.]
MPPRRLARCKRHPTATAGWRCTDCAAPLCPECVEARRMQTVDLLFCRACGGRADTILLHRSELASFPERLRQVWRYPFTRQGLMVAAGLGAVMAVVDFMTQITLIVARLAPAAIGAGLFWGAFFSIMRASVRGENEVPLPDYGDVFNDWLLPALRGLLATSVVWLTFLLYLAFAGGWDVSQYVDRLLSDSMFYMTGRFHSLPTERLLGDPLAWLLGLTSLAWLPMALMMAVTSNSLLDTLNPLPAVRGMLRLGRDYAVAVVTLFALGLVYLAVRSVSSSLRELPFELVISRWLAQVLECLVVFTMARVLGLLIHTRGDALGYGAPSDYLTPVLPAEATPRTTLRVDPTALQAPSPAEAAAPSPEARLQELSTAVQARDIPQALALYTALGFLPKARIPPAVHLFVGQASAAQGDNALAVRALESVADSAPEDPLAPRALVLLARVLGERMQEQTRAEDVYRYIVDRYPDTEASRFARGRLPPTS